MKSRLTQKPGVRTGLRLSLRMKVAIGIGLLVIVAGTVILIVLNTGTSKQSKAEVKNSNGPASNNAYFDASDNSYIDFGRGKKLDCIKDIPNGKQLTITLWLKWDNLNGPGVGSWANLLSLCDSTGNGDNGVFWVQHNQMNDKFEFALNITGSGRQFIQSTTQPVAGTWYHIACVYNGTSSYKKMYLYVNGTLEATLKNLTGNIAPISNSAKLNMGRWCNPQNQYRHFNGFIDEVSIWDIALTQTQISSIIDDPTNVTGSSYNANGLIGYWNFDNNTAQNLTGCQNDGIIGSAVVLPIELISFTAEKTGNKVILKWSTASEKNNDFFTIEKSTDLKSFNVIGTVKGAGNSNSLIDYSSVDENPGNVVCYYRLKQTDYDGASEYSNVVAVNEQEGTKSIGTLTAGPNPFTDHINLNYKATEPGTIEILLYDMTGKIIRKQSDEVETGTTTLVLDNIADLPSGYYMAGIRQNNVTTPLIKMSKAK